MIGLKKIIIVNLCVLLILFFTAGMLASPKDDEALIKDSMESRIKILNEYYSGAKNFDDAGRQLELVENSTLLRRDTDAMEANSATDIDKISAYDITILNFSKSSHGIISGEAEIYWRLSGHGKETSQHGIYFFTGEMMKNRMKLTQFELQ